MKSRKRVTAFLLSVLLVFSCVKVVSAADNGIAVLDASTVTCGFAPNSSSSGVKKTGSSSRNSDGTNTYVVKFFCDGTESWINQHITFEVENVTPDAYMEMFESTGVGTSITSVEITSGSVYFDGTEKSGLLINSAGQFEVPGVVDSSGTLEYTGKYAVSGKKITVKADAGVRALKVTALEEGTVIDTVYVLTNGKDSSGQYSDYDEQFYQQVKEYVEGRLWTDEMSNREKLDAMASYINTTTHYSGSDATSKATNPDYRKRWVVDDQDFYLVGTDWGPLSDVDVLQGGIGTCVFAYNLEEYAEDMGLKNLKDSASGDIAPGEGVWVACGAESSNPGNPAHCSLIYQSAEGTRTYYDVQGMFTVCSVHDCASKILPLSFTFQYTPSERTGTTSDTNLKSEQTLTSGNSASPSASLTNTVQKKPKATSLKSVNYSKRKGATVKWKKVSGVTGYQIQYSTNSSFRKKKTVKVRGASKSSKTLTGWKRGKTYYVRIRTYKTVSGKNVFSSWSKKKKVKTKK